jgi:hypothetical protein
MFGFQGLKPNLVHLKKETTLSFVTRGVIGVIGFILSPLTWWNDLFVNVPLSYAFAYLIGSLLRLFVLISKDLFINLFMVGYFLTNLIGLLMMHYSVFGVRRGKVGSFKTEVLVSAFYTLVILVCFTIGLSNLAKALSIFPSWVKP